LYINAYVQKSSQIFIIIVESIAKSSSPPWCVVVGERRRERERHSARARAQQQKERDTKKTERKTPRTEKKTREETL
jgi:hypothetical protein